MCLPRTLDVEVGETGPGVAVPEVELNLGVCGFETPTTPRPWQDLTLDTSSVPPECQPWRCASWALRLRIPDTKIPPRSATERTLAFVLALEGTLSKMCYIFACLLQQRTLGVGSVWDGVTFS